MDNKNESPKAIKKNVHQLVDIISSRQIEIIKENKTSTEKPKAKRKK